jgi:hypothetical protein
VECSAHRDPEPDRGSVLGQHSINKDARTSKRSLLIEVQSTSDTSRHAQEYRLYKRRYAGLAALVSNDVIAVIFIAQTRAKDPFEYRVRNASAMVRSNSE